MPQFLNNQCQSADIKIFEKDKNSDECSICGESHNISQCFYLVDFNHVKDKIVLSRAQQTLPSNLEVIRMVDGSTSVVSKCQLMKGTTFGPFEGKRIWSMSPMTSFPIKIFGNSPNDSYFLDYSEEESSNWMSFISPASNSQEQNLICYQVKDDIFYTVDRNISIGEELKVWYSPNYAKKLNIPVHEDKKVDVLNAGKDTNCSDQLSSEQMDAQETNEKDKWSCHLCLVELESISVYAKHLMDHYKPLLRAKHQDEKNDLNLSFDSDTLQLLDNNNTNHHLSPEETINLLNNRKVSCAICNKTFQQVDYLYRHLKKHTGEFMCPNCLKVFARKENLMSHTCLSAKQLRGIEYECPYCQKNFKVKKYLIHHMTKHFEFNSCKWCRCIFNTQDELDNHKCTAHNHTCEECGKRFIHGANLNRHMKTHSKMKPIVKKTRKRSEEESSICEKCGEIFKSPYSLNQHLKSHGERLFECEICNSRFHRQNVLNEHKKVHSSYPIPCEICGKMLKNKKVLDVHVLMHGNKKFQCQKCDKSFYQRSNFLKHQRTHFDKLFKCSKCTSEFTSQISLDRHCETHSKSKEFICSICNKGFGGQYKLKRHVQSTHSGVFYRCPYCKSSAKHRHSMKRHLQRKHSEHFDDWNTPKFLSTLEEKSDDTEKDDVAVDTNDVNNVNVKDINLNRNSILLNVDSAVEAFSNKRNDSLNNETVLMNIKTDESFSIPEDISNDQNVNLSETVMMNVKVDEFSDKQNVIMNVKVDETFSIPENGNVNPEVDETFISENVSNQLNQIIDNNLELLLQVSNIEKSDMLSSNSQTLSDNQLNETMFNNTYIFDGLENINTSELISFVLNNTTSTGIN